MAAGMVPKKAPTLTTLVTSRSAGATPDHELGLWTKFAKSGIREVDFIVRSSYAFGPAGGAGGTPLTRACYNAHAGAARWGSLLVNRAPGCLGSSGTISRSGVCVAGAVLFKWPAPFSKASASTR